MRARNHHRTSGVCGGNIVAERYKVTDISRATLPKDFERNPRIHVCYELEKTS